MTRSGSRTRGGAAVLRRDDIGSLEPGKCADFAVWRTDGLELGGAGDLVAGIVFAGPHRVDLLVVGGEAVVRDGALVNADEARDRAGPSRRSAKVHHVSVSLSTHVLDTAAGQPAAGVAVELLLGDAAVASAQTDADGRARLAESLEPGVYSLVFHPPSPFFRRVQLELELEDGHYHVPLLVSPYSCASYRGS